MIGLNARREENTLMTINNVSITPRAGGWCRSKDAFTLVELAVVIVTLGILDLLLLPAMATSNNFSGRTVCTNNLKQLGMAAKMYAGDNQDYLAWPNWDGGSGAQSGWLYTPTSGAIPNPNSLAWKPPANSADSAWKTGLWFQYVLDFKAYLCPVDMESPTYTAVAVGRANKLSSYLMNGSVAGFPSPENAHGYKTAKITQVWSPLCYLLWEPDENAAGPGNPGAFDYNDGANFPSSSEGIGRLHTSNGGEMLSVAGNVQFVTVKKWNTETVGIGSGPLGQSLAWWNPFSSNGH
jgi:type II secretory pathway pseudopilin PulG